MEDIEVKPHTTAGVMAQTVRVTKVVTCTYISVLLVGMGLVLGASIILRFFFDQPVAWSNTITRYAYIHIVLLGAAVSYMEGSHAQIDVIYQRVPRKMQLGFDLVHNGVMLFLCSVLTVMGAKHVVNMWQVHSPIITGFPVGVVYLAVPLCAVVMVIFIFQRLVDLKDRKEG
ncbi:TRAP transporter small permease [Desulfosediminicola sp.]|uniref:TRAP transporter small permease n=1 Tax=Desulfosediminicola sp. TaxID=2886825 RepID=UPI003AF2A9EB